MNLKEIVAGYLKTHGYEGLYNEYECVCDISDLMPCDGPRSDCSPGYRINCPEDHEFDFMITADKAKKDCTDEY